MTKQQFTLLLSRAFDGLQAAGRNGDSKLGDSYQLGMCVALFIVRAAVDGDPIALASLEAWAAGDSELGSVLAMLEEDT